MALITALFEATVMVMIELSVPVTVNLSNKVKYC